MTRDLVFTGFEGDDGSAEESLAAALVGEDPTELMAVLPASRLLVPIVAEPVETETRDGLTVDSRTDMAAVTLVKTGSARCRSSRA